jgi:hypothetical protein
MNNDVLERIANALDQIVSLLEKKWNLSVGIDMEWPDGTKSWVAHTQEEVEEMFKE